jgi:hypothetical protein
MQPYKFVTAYIITEKYLYLCQQTSRWSDGIQLPDRLWGSHSLITNGTADKAAGA